MKIKLSFWIQILFPLFGVSQDTTIISQDKLFHSIDSFYNAAASAEQLEFKEITKREWLKYIPNVGIGYSLGADKEGNLKNVIRPSISLSSSIIYQSHKDKQANQLKVKSIKEVAFLQASEDKRKVKELLAEYQLKIDDINYFKILLEIDEQLHKLAIDKYNSGEILPNEFLRLKQTYLSKQYQLFQKYQNLSTIKQKIYVISKLGFMN